MKAAAVGAALLGVLVHAATAAALAAAPRVVSVGGAVTEIVCELGAASWLAAVDTTSTFPREVMPLPKVGYQRTLAAEGIVALAPTLILASADAGPPATLQQLQTAGIRLVRMRPEHSFEAMLANVRLTAEALGLEQQGRALAQRLDEDWKATQASIVRNGKAPRVVFVLSHAASSVQVAGVGTAADTMIRLAGGVNALQGFEGYRPLSTEAIVAAAPDVILATREGI